MKRTFATIGGGPIAAQFLGTPAFAAMTSIGGFVGNDLTILPGFSNQFRDQNGAMNNSLPHRIQLLELPPT
jgi:hypothetical protein